MRFDALRNGLGLLLAPDDAGGAVAEKPVVKEETIKPSKVEEELAATRQKLAESEQLKEHMSTLFDPNKSAAEREVAARQGLSRMGYTADQINQWVSLNLGSSSETEQGGEVGGETASSPDLGELSKRIERIEKSASEVRKDQLNQAFDETLDKVLTEDKDLNTLLDATKRLRGAEKVPEAKERLKRNLAQEAMRRFRKRMDTTGEVLSERWMAEEVKKAVSEVVSSQSAVIGDASSLGRASETSTGATNPFAGKKPVPEPKYNDKKSLGEIEKEMTDWFTDDMSRAAAEIGDGKAGSRL